MAAEGREAVLREEVAVIRARPMALDINLMYLKILGAIALHFVIFLLIR